MAKKIEFLVKFAPKGRIPSSDFYKMRRGEVVPSPPLEPKFHHRVALEMWAEIRQNRQNMDFFITNPPIGANPLKRFFFTKFGVGR